MPDTNLSSLVKVAPLLDEDDMASDSAAHGATQQSIRAYAATGPVASIDEAYPRFNGVGGRILQDSLSTEDDAGIVTHSGQSAARAYLAGNQTVASGAWVKLQLVTESYDVQNEFVPYAGGDPTNTARFVATVAGKYQICALVLVRDLDDTDSLLIGVKINGVFTAINSVRMSGAAQDSRVNIADVFILAANDYVDLWLNHGQGANQTALAIVYSNFLTVTKLH